jgi:hypothetical protein
VEEPPSLLHDLIRFEAPLVTVPNEPAVLNRLQMEPGKYYCFYRESLVTLNAAPLIEQLLLQKSRDVFVPKPAGVAELRQAVAS